MLCLIFGRKLQFHHGSGPAADVSDFGRHENCASELHGHFVVHEEINRL